MEHPAPSLKLVSAWSENRSVREQVGVVLRGHAGQDEVRFLHGRVFLVHTAAEPSVIRDWLMSCLEEGDSVFVAEFSSWAGHGSSPDHDWLLRRGH